MSSSTPGRHRAPRRPLVAPLARASATLLATGGLVAGLSATAQAVPMPARPSVALPAQPGGIATTPRAVPSTPAVLPATQRSWSTVRYGARGGKVVSIQRIVGAYPDGVFGPKTRAAVKRYQARKGLVSDGIVGPRTARAMGLSSSGGRDGSSASRSTGRSSAPGGVLGVAQRYTGIMYRYGGSSPSGFDCSGFTKFVFGKVGIGLPRSAEAQRRAARWVSSPRPGDLVFWGSPAYHVAIYAGNGMVYDSGRSGLPTQKRKMFSGVSSFGRVG